ncbi:small conductance mechanosensitive channel [Jatrophihabitans sp. GAS493]|uniref:mechanosensitive ion channel family protein n=1 Tax=Jatrophihabitans sp. GAS493 TaxID=1907575 RepID=UPI000BB843BA|nr:mechanosensitive ion channel domain-containing protein [Jatrophihabitans sp. GAS493]SOD72840.1 small conductance mechanosensitive channel [Jatrophihabitans sp. GAS493]
MAKWATVYPQVLAESRLLEDHTDVLIARPLKILAIVLIAVVLRKLAHRFVDRITNSVSQGSVPRILNPLKERVSQNGFLESAGLVSERRRQRSAAIGSVLNSITSFVILTVSVLLILDELGINMAPFIAGTSIVGVAIGFGAQNVVKDFLAGIFMILEDQYGVGDVIDFEKATGVVEAVGLRTTQLRDVYGTVWYVRNGEVVRVGNQSQGYAEVVLDIPIAASAQIEPASQAIMRAAEQLHGEQEWAGVFLGEPQLQGVESFTRDETVIRLVARVRPLQQWRTARELRRRIKANFDELDLALVAESVEERVTPGGDTLTPPPGTGRGVGGGVDGGDGATE